MLWCVTQQPARLKSDLAELRGTHQKQSLLGFDHDAKKLQALPSGEVAVARVHHQPQSLEELLDLFYEALRVARGCALRRGAAGDAKEVV